MSGKHRRTKQRKIIPLPKNIRDELRLTCVLKGFSIIKCGAGKRLSKQQAELSEFFHGKAPHRPSQIKLLSDASLCYRDLYEKVTNIATKKNDDLDSIVNYKLKDSLTLDLNRQYYSRGDITALDLEKKN